MRTTGSLFRYITEFVRPSHSSFVCFEFVWPLNYVIYRVGQIKVKFLALFYFSLFSNVSFFPFDSWFKSFADHTQI